MKNLSQTELNQLQAEALSIYSTSSQARLDAKYGECKSTKQLKENFRVWLGGKLSSRKMSVISELVEVRGEGVDKAKVLELMNASFDRYEVLVRLMTEYLN